MTWIEKFLRTNLITDKSGKRLEGGTLSELLENAFAASGHEEQAEDKFRLKDIEEQLGLKPGMTHEQKEAALAQAEGFPAIKGLVAEYRSRIESKASQQTVQQDRTEVLNRLYQFFSRHYQDGDFIVERRYGSDFKVTARPAAVALGALTMAGRNNQDVMAR